MFSNISNKEAAQNIHYYVLAIEQKGGGTKEILINMKAFFPTLKILLDTISKDEFNFYLEHFPGFCTFSKVLQTSLITQP